MYTALERNRLYQLGTSKLIYKGRDFPEDHPTVFNFVDQDTDELMTFSIEQLTVLEREGDFKYLGVSL